MPLPNGDRVGTEVARLSAAEVVDWFATSEEGLASSEAATRLKRFGPNRPPRPRHTPWLVDFAHEFVHQFALLLWTASLLAWWAGMSPLAAAIVVVIVVNGVFSYWQQFKAEQAVQALESLLPHQVTVRRDGEVVSVPADEVALGDLLILAEGAAVPADARLIRAERLRVDVSSLTGESRPVGRSATACAVGDQSIAEIPNLVLAGTFVVAGRAEAVVFATGAQTEFGRLAALTHVQPAQASPLQRELGRVTRVVTVLAVGMGVTCFALAWGTGRLTLVDGLIFALGIIVANVPEGLLPTLSLALAIGVRRMAKRNAIVKRLERVEALGAVTVILTDKTGTLTHNQMTVRGIWRGGCRYEVDGDGYEPTGVITRDKVPISEPNELHELLRAAVLCCDATLRPPGDGESSWSAGGDPTEVAILVAARKAGITEPLATRFPRLAEIPFDSVRKRMTTVHATGQQAIACMKGALSELLPRCESAEGFAETASDWRRRVAEAAQDFADRGWRVLAVATRRVELPPVSVSSQAVPEATGPLAIHSAPATPTASWPSHVDSHLEIDPESMESNMTLLGLVAMEDPPRAEVPSAITSCLRAGIRIIMATGDDGHTATAIAREIGLASAARVVTGRELDLTSERSLGLLLGRKNVLFARVTPAHKLRLVEALQSRGEVVAVTGDGVNDAPALRRADAGVAMGRRGTDVARSAADVILLDDNFATIVAAIEEGRAVYDNVRKFVSYIFASNVPEIVPFMAFVLLRVPLPLTVMQVLAVDLGTDLLPALALGVEPPERDLMLRPPRARSAPLLTWPTLLRAYGWLGAIEAILCLTGFFLVYLRSGWRPGQPMAETGTTYTIATTMSLAGIVACQVGNGLACRSERRSILSLGLRTNAPLLLGIVAELLILLALIHVPALAKAFQLAPLSAVDWLVLASFGPILLLAEELRKLVVRAHWRR